jgi:crotonobetaine/carnitine-CoA ligase
VFDPTFSASRFVARVRELESTLFVGVGFHPFSILRQPERHDDAIHDMRAMAAGPVSIADQSSFEQRFGISLITQIYGQTEVSMACVNALDQQQVPGTAGRAAPWLLMQIVDESDWPLPVGSVGEVVFRPRFPGVTFDGYWNRPAATVNTLANCWLHTGDLGRVDAMGNLTYVGRKTDSIRRRGENVSAFEVERAIMSHPSVSDVAVHAVDLPDEPESVIKACIVLDGGQALTPEEFFTFVAGELPYFAVPRLVEVVSELPRNASGRVVKTELVDRGHGDHLWDLELMSLLRPDKRRS